MIDAMSRSVLFVRPRPAQRLTPPRRAVLLMAVVLLMAAPGCAPTKYATLRPVPKSPLAGPLKLMSKTGPQPSKRTEQFLRVYDLTEARKGDPREFLEQVQKVLDREPTADNIYAVAELSFIEAKKAEPLNPQLALDLYGASVLHAYRYLFDERFRRFRNPYDPHFRGACDLYNGALESGLRIACKDERGLLPGQTYTLETASGSWKIECSLRAGPWCEEDFERFEFVSDYEIQGLRNHYHTYGLGVPLIAVRQNYPGEPAAARYYPPNLSFPVTAFMRPLPGGDPDSGGGDALRHAVLELYDPQTAVDTALGDLCVPLETDLTTPLAYFLSDSTLGLESLATIGLLKPEALLAIGPDNRKPVMGLYMVQPYEPGKIPVLLVHGLWSSPMTWMQMFNDLRASPEIREHYQFWFYLYPTAQPFWLSAAQLRRDLAEVRRTLDPYRREPALDQIVLIGHSMGGLVSRLQTIDSGDDFWRIVSDQPFSLVQAEPETRERLQQCFFFEPNPSVRRVITVGTPHRGSEFSNSFTQWLTSKLITLPEMLVLGKHKLLVENRELIRDDRLLRIETSIDSLDPRSPFFPVMLAGYTAPWVKYHNVIGMVPKRGLFGKLAAGGDGVVAYESATMDDVESELIVPADHTTIHAHPRAVLEVKRILLEHLAEMRASPGGPVRTATSPWPRPPDSAPRPTPQRSLGNPSRSADPQNLPVLGTGA